MTFKSMTRSEREQAYRDIYIMRRLLVETMGFFRGGPHPLKGDDILLKSGSIADIQRGNLRHSVGGDFISCFSRGITPVR